MVSRPRSWPPLLAVAIAVALGSDAAAARIAEPSAAAAPTSDQTAAPETSDETAPGAAAGRALSPRPEYLRSKPSGFWTSNAPAKHGAYRYRMLGIGVGIFAITVFFVVRALRRAGARRAGLAGSGRS